MTSAADIAGPAPVDARPAAASEAPSRASARARDRAAEGGAFGGGFASLQRRPKDGWREAAPFPMMAFHRRRLRGLIRVHMPVALLEDNPDGEALVERIEHGVRVFMAYMPWLVAFGLSLMFLVVDWSPRWTFRGIRRIGAMPVDEGRAAIQALMDSGMPHVHLVLYAVRGVVASVLYDQDEAWALIGYDPMPHLRGRIDLRKRMLAGEAPRPDDAFPTPDPEGIPAIPGVNP